MCCCSSADPDMAVTGPRQKTNGFLAAATLWIVETETASSQPSHGASGEAREILGGLGESSHKLKSFCFPAIIPILLDFNFLFIQDNKNLPINILTYQ